MKLCSIASGSSGNCIYAGTGQANLLVDAGISGKRIETGLQAIGKTTAQMDGILITHEHSDHISGLGVVARKHKIPIYATEGTLEQILSAKSVGKISEELFHVIEADRPFFIGDVKVCPFHIDHDAVDPVAYRIENDGKAVGIATDLGHYTEYTVERLKGLDALLLEANHDIRMLQAGSYPYYLKQRILGERGHLSNETSGRLLCELISEKLKYVLLGHLSRENNYEALACETVRLELLSEGVQISEGKISLKVAKRDCVSELIAV